MGSSPHLCTVALNLPGGCNEIRHDHKGAVPLEVRGRGGETRALSWENSTPPRTQALPQQALRIHMIPSGLHNR